MKERIQIKHDTAANWAKAINFIPLEGELILYDGILENGSYKEIPRLKVGDGVHKLAELPFLQSASEQKENKYQYADGVLIID